MKATKKSISLPQSKCPLIKTIDCIIQSLRAVEVEWFLFYAPTIAQDWLLSRADINKLVKLNIIKPIMSLFPQRMRQSLTLMQIAWISLSRVFILLKCHHFGISRFNREI